MFGKRKRPPAQSPQGSGDGAAGTGPNGAASLSFPWADDPASIACNLAAGNLANNLASWVEREGRVHAETYVAASGAIAGYAAQQSLRAQDSAVSFQVVTTSSGEKYLFGDPLNDMFFARTEAETTGRVWPRAAGATMSLGVPLTRLPGTDEMFAHVSQSLGGPLEGRPSTGPAHQPMVPVRQLLTFCWPQVARLFEADFDDTHRRFGPVPPNWWCAVAASAASRPIIDVKDVLDPTIALTILMESAIYASKLTSL